MHFMVYLLGDIINYPDILGYITNFAILNGVIKKDNYLSLINDFMQTN